MRNFTLSFLSLLTLSASTANALNVIGMKVDGESDIFPLTETLELCIKPVLSDSLNPTFNIVSDKETSTDYKNIRFSHSNAVDQKMSPMQPIAVYPNPVRRMIYLTDVDENSEVEIVNVSGVVVKRHKGTEIDVADLASGIYVLKVASSQVKFIKQ